MADMGNISGGMDATRLSAEEQAALARAERRTTARGNLAALLVDVAGGLEAVRADGALAIRAAAEFAELCEILGLDSAVEYAPGICRRTGCDKEISIEAQVRPRGYERKGFCSTRCERLANLRNVEAVS